MSRYNSRLKHITHPNCRFNLLFNIIPPSVVRFPNLRPTILFTIVWRSARCSKFGAWLLVDRRMTPPWLSCTLIPSAQDYHLSRFDSPLLVFGGVGFGSLEVGDNKHIVMVKLYWSCFISHKIVNCISILIYVCIYKFKCALHKVEHGIFFLIVGRNGLVICFYGCLLLRILISEKTNAFVWECC